MGRPRDFYPPPMKENPKGFFEDIRFRRINDDILKANKYKVKSFSSDIPIIHIIRDNKVRERMLQLANDRNEWSELWGWKDPRNSLTLASWLDLFDTYGIMETVRVIVTHRNATDVAESMKRRGNKERFPNQFEKLAIAYQERLYGTLSAFEVKTFPVIFEDLLFSTEILARKLSVFIGRELHDLSFVEPAISRRVSK